MRGIITTLYYNRIVEEIKQVCTDVTSGFVA